MPYEVSTPVFEGPFDLLLHLILKEEVDLWEISLVGIVDAFCNEVERMESLDLESTTEFLLIAATLVELKSRRLLPGREELDQSAIRLEEMYLGLRTRNGVPEQQVSSALRTPWIGSGWAELQGGRIRLTPEGWLRLDALVASI